MSTKIINYVTLTLHFASSIHVERSTLHFRLKMYKISQKIAMSNMEPSSDIRHFNMGMASLSNIVYRICCKNIADGGTGIDL